MNFGPLIFRSPNFRSPTPVGGGGGSTSEEEINVEALQERIQQLEEDLENERRQFQAEMRKGQEAIDRMRRPSSEPDPSTAVPTHAWNDGYDVVTQQRVAVFVDVQNMYYAARNLYSSKLEFSKLLRFLGRGRPLCRAIAYIVERPGMEQDKFIEVLKRNGYEVHKKVLIERADGSQKGDWDLGIALDAVALADRIDAAVLVTGDGDFTALCRYLRTRGVRVEVASFPESTAVELAKAADHFHRLDEQVLLPGAQFQSPTESGSDRMESRRDHFDDDAEDDEDAEFYSHNQGRRKRARGPLDDDLSEDDFKL